MAHDPGSMRSANTRFRALLEKLEEQHLSAAEAFDRMEGNRMLEVGRRAA